MAWLESRFGVVIAVCGVLAGASASSASPIAYEGFAYSAGTLSSDNGGSGWSGGWTTTGTSENVSSTGFTYTDSQGAVLPVSGGSASMLNGDLSFRAPTSAPNSGILYISFIAQNTGSGGYEGLSLYNGTGSELLFLGAPSTSATWGIATKGTGSAVANSSTSNANSTFLVYEINFGAGSTAVGPTITEYDNPTLASQPGTASASITAASPFGSAWNEIRIASGNGDVGTFDEIHIGTNYADVVPEPSAGLLFLGGLGAAALRRRRTSRLA